MMVVEGMNQQEQRESVLPYGRPPAPAPWPARWGEVGCVSSAIGAILFGVIVPWTVMRSGFVYDGAPSLVVWALLMLVAIAGGIVLGALLVPIVVLGPYWVIWRIAGRP